MRTDKSGGFRQILDSKLSGFTWRSAHFTYPLLLAGASDLAAAQERYAIHLAIKDYGATSAELMYAYNEMGTLRGWARSYLVGTRLPSQSR